MMTKKVPGNKKKAGRTAKRRVRRSRALGLPVLLDREPPQRNCHVTVQGDPPYGKCEDGGDGTCTFPGLKVGGKTTQMILCQTNGEAQLFLQAPKRRFRRRTKS